MPSSRAALKISYRNAAGAMAGTIVPLFKAPALPSFGDRAACEAYRAWQQVRQEQMLARNLANAASPAQDSDRAQQQQVSPHTPELMAEIRKQAAMQERRGSAFRL